MTMVYPDRAAIEGNVRAFFQDQQVIPHLDYLYALLPKNSALLIAGGAIRNVVIHTVHGWAPPTRDIDIFIQCDDGHFNPGKLFQDREIRKTDLGGIRWKPVSSPYFFDLCRIKDFVIINKYNLGQDRDTLLACLDFTANAIIYDFKEQRLYETGCIEAVKQKLLDTNTKKLYSKLLFAYRILVIRYKIEFVLSRQLFRFLKNGVDVDLLISLRNLLFSKQARVKARLLINDFNRICSYRDYDDYRTRAFESLQKS